MSDLYPLKPTDEQREALVRNILKVYRRATPDQLERGESWYRTAHDLAVIIGGTASVGAGILAVLSAQREWLETIRLAQEVAGTAQIELSQRQFKTMQDQEDKVKRIMMGEDPDRVLPRGLKTWNFYHTINDPDTWDHVVIDRHAYDIAVGTVAGEDRRGLDAITRYEVFADAYREAARRLRAKPSEVQAVTWVRWRDLKGLT